MFILLCASTEFCPVPAHATLRSRGLFTSIFTRPQAHCGLNFISAKSSSQSRGRDRSQGHYAMSGGAAHREPSVRLLQLRGYLVHPQQGRSEGSTVSPCGRGLRSSSRGMKWEAEKEVRGKNIYSRPAVFQLLSYITQGSNTCRFSYPTQAWLANGGSPLEH